MSPSWKRLRGRGRNKQVNARDRPKDHKGKKRVRRSKEKGTIHELRGNPFPVNSSDSSTVCEISSEKKALPEAKAQPGAGVPKSGPSR